MKHVFTLDPVVTLERSASPRVIRASASTKDRVSQAVQLSVSVNNIKWSVAKHLCQNGVHVKSATWLEHRRFET